MTCGGVWGKKFGGVLTLRAASGRGAAQRNWISAFAGMTRRLPPAANRSWVPHIYRLARRAGETPTQESYHEFLFYGRYSYAILSIRSYQAVRHHAWNRTRDRGVFDPMETQGANRKLGGALALAAAALIAAQPPLSSPAAKTFSTVQFLFLTQVALLVSVPLLLASKEARRDFVAALDAPSNLSKLAAIFAVGVVGLLLYTVSLSHAHPVVVVAILNLSPFWAALVAFFLTKTPIPATPVVFFSCLAVAFLGATAVAWSQAGDRNGLAAELIRGTWIFAIPIPLFTTLAVTLTGKWFSELNTSGVVAANCLIGSVILIPVTLIIMHARGESVVTDLAPTLLMIVGIILADVAGRVFSQKAMKAVDNDNGFVTMFQNLEPAIAALISFALSPWIKGLSFAANWVFFAGLALAAASLFVFSWKLLQQPTQPSPAPTVVPRGRAVLEP